MDRCGRQSPAPLFGELAEAWRLIARLLATVLGTPVPRTDLTHSAAAAFCGLPYVPVRVQWGTPYLLTEHGVYLREQYLNLGASIRSYFVRWLLLRLIAAVVDVNYAFADQLSPVCRYNTRWERWRNVESERVHVIYNGVDPSRFSPAPDGFARHERPLVVNVGLIFPLKGQRRSDRSGRIGTKERTRRRDPALRVAERPEYMPGARSASGPLI